MKVNMGKADKYLRITIGIIAILLGIYFESWWGVLGVIPIMTSVINWCPFYVPFKISTISKQKDS